MKDKDHDLSVEAVGAYNVLYLDNAEIVATLADVAVSGADTAPGSGRSCACATGRDRPRASSRRSGR